jgi:hypothetical protein
MFRQLEAMGLGVLYTIGDRIILKRPMSFSNVDVSLQFLEFLLDAYKNQMGEVS